MADRVRPKPRNHDARRDRAERLKGSGSNLPSEMFGDVILTRDVPESGLRAGDVGMVVERHAVAGVSEDATRSSLST